MKHGLLFAIIVLSTLLAGCATPTVRSDVTVFQEWPSDLQGSSFAFERSKEQENDLEYRSYENLVRAELQHLGFVEAPKAEEAKLKAAISYDIDSRDVQIVEPVVIDPFWYDRPFYHPGWRGYYGPHYGPYYRPYYAPFYSPFYDPFWYGPPLVEYRESNSEVFKRQLRISISRTADAVKLYNVSVVSEGRDGSLAKVMPYMVRSAFTGFPGKNGELRHVVLPMKDKNDKG